MEVLVMMLARLREPYVLRVGHARVKVGGPIDAPMGFITSTPPIREKFEDPWISEVLSPSRVWGEGGGRDYLRDVPADGESRVRAMLDKVAAHGHDMPPGVDSLLEMANQIKEVVLSEIKKHAEAEAKKYVNQAINSAAVIATEAGAGFYAIAAKAAYDAMAPTLWEVVEHGFKNPMEANRQDQYYRDSVAWYKKTVDYGFPVLWQATTQGGHVAEDFANWYERNFMILFGLPFEEQAIVRRWWNTMLLTFRDPIVEPVYRAMGGGWIGSIGLASDEQVMLVAYPIAKSYDLDPRTLAVALWNRSKGWSGARDLLHPYSYFDKADGMNSIPGRSATTPANALAVQYYVLARDAFAIAEEGRETGSIRTTGPILEKAMGLISLQVSAAKKEPPGDYAAKLLEDSEGGRVSGLVPLGVGIAAGVGLKVAGASLAVSAAPLAAAIAYLVWRNRS